MMSSTVWARLVLSLATLHSVCSVAPCCRSARLAGIDHDACSHVLQAHDDLDIRRLGNVHAYVRNIRA
jgi:hypothetical protein